ncbi:hypothetical protein [Candidatus Uabimicrobium sp. HlEnr_7]|uniref:hypothetical protein n=1 Tax=Candidatus Uabimicrobium helgolandensis TaxID=3095367 RepID=UPI0035585BC2
MKKRKIKCDYPIQKSFPKQKLGEKVMEVKDLYICIWPANPNIKERIAFDIFYQDTKNHNNEYHANSLGAELKKGKQISLLFDKTAKDLENSSRNFLFMQKGSYIRIESSNYTNGYYIFDRNSGDRRRKYFEGMLDNIKSSTIEKQSLIDYIDNHFPNIKTFSFGIYLKVPFSVSKDCYVFENNLDIPIWSVLVLGKIDSPKARYTIADVDLLKKLPPKAIVETPLVSDESTDQCSAEDLGKMRRTIFAFIKDVYRENENAAEKIIDTFMDELAELKDEIGLPQNFDGKL